MPPTLARRVDGKPLPVGGSVRTGQAPPPLGARRWQAADHKERGYKLFLVWGGGGVVPDAWHVGPMGEAEVAVAQRPVPELAGLRLCRLRRIAA